MEAGAWEIDSRRFGVAEISVLKYIAREIFHKAKGTEEVSSTVEISD